MNAAEAAALLAALPPAGRLETRLRLLASGEHPQVWLPRQRPVVLGMALRAALRDGVPERTVAEILRDSHAMQGPVGMDDLMAVPLAVRSKSWLSWWCRYLPRILVCAARGAISRTAQGRTYTTEEVEEMVVYRVTAEAETMTRWLSLAQWAIQNLYPEWARRIGRDHVCFGRVLQMAQTVNAERWYDPQNAELPRHQQENGTHDRNNAATTVAWQPEHQEGVDIPDRPRAEQSGWQEREDLGEVA